MTRFEIPNRRGIITDKTPLKATVKAEDTLHAKNEQKAEAGVGILS